MIIEIMNPITPIISIPSAETLVVISNSFLVGFFNAYQTLLHLKKNDFVGTKTLFIMF